MFKNPGLRALDFPHQARVVGIRAQVHRSPLGVGGSTSGCQLGGNICL
jgi:hypothetical protein